MAVRTLLLASALLAGLFGSSAADPVPIRYHAFCKTFWLFPTHCAGVSTKLVDQIKAFNPKLGCDQCQYKLVTVSPTYIYANHTSGDDGQAENITFSFSPTVLTDGCRVTAQSNSLGFTSLLDDGLNYCNLYNLLAASGLSSVQGFTEMTNEWACLGYGLATCKDKPAEM